VHVHGGTGGRGLAKYNGIGGKGGDVFVVAEENASLKRIVSLCPGKRFGAPTGEDSRYALQFIKYTFSCYMLLLLV